MCHLWFTSEKRRVCAVCIKLIPSGPRRCGSICCVIRDSSARGLCFTMLAFSTSADKSYAAYEGTVHHGSSPSRPCPPCKLTSSHFSCCLQQHQGVRRIYPNRRMRVKLGVPRPPPPSARKAFLGRAFSCKSMFRRNRHHHARADDNADLSRLSVVLSAIVASWF